MKKIAFVIGGMTRGGAERVISILANSYIKKGWEVYIVMMLSSKNEYDLDNRIRLIDIKQKYMFRFLNIPYWMFSLRKLIIEENIDTIVSFFTRINIIVLIATIGLKIRRIVSERNDPYNDGRSYITDTISRFLYKYANMLVLQTKRSKKYYENEKKINSIIIPNPIVIYAKKAQIRKNKIVAVGRLEPQKNHAMLISAFYEVNKLNKDFDLWIYGEGSLKDDLLKQCFELGIHDKVHFPGNVKDIHKRISDASIFVLSSDYEGLSNALLEAMLMGIPCISTMCAGADEYIEDLYSGCLIDVGNKNQLVDRINLLIKDDRLKNKLSSNGVISASRCTYESVINLWEEIIENK